MTSLHWKVRSDQFVLLGEITQGEAPKLCCLINPLARWRFYKRGVPQKGKQWYQGEIQLQKWMI